MIIRENQPVELPPDVVRGKRLCSALNMSCLVFCLVEICNITNQVSDSLCFCLLTDDF